MGWLYKDYSNIIWEDPVEEIKELSVDNFKIKLMVKLEPNR